MISTGEELETERAVHSLQQHFCPFKCGFSLLGNKIAAGF
jgi:hypothetical protein